jgi:hypothetical protein
VLFLVIGLGMACGHGSLGVALVGALLGSGLLAVLDLFQVPDAPAPEVEASGARSAIAPAIARIDVGKRP